MKNYNRYLITSRYAYRHPDDVEVEYCSTKVLKVGDIIYLDETPFSVDEVLSLADE